MNKDLENRITELERKVDSIRRTTDIEFTESMRRNVIDEVIFAGVVDSASAINQSIGAAQSFSSPKSYNARVLVEIDNVKYYIGLHEL